MKYLDFAKTNKTNLTIYLKDGRILYTTDNGFKYWIRNKKGDVVDEVTEDYFNKAKKLRINKKNR